MMDGMGPRGARHQIRSGSVLSAAVAYSFVATVQLLSCNPAACLTPAVKMNRRCCMQRGLSAEAERVSSRPQVRVSGSEDRLKTHVGRHHGSTSPEQGSPPREEIHLHTRPMHRL
jgi:hypothetical protein